MALERATVLYPLNSTTVDTGTGIDIRLLSNAQPGASDNTSQVQWAHTQDGAERTFDPATLSTSILDARTLQKLGWALRLSEDMTPADDTNCDAMLPAGTLTVRMRANFAGTGGTNLGGVNTVTLRASLWRYNPSTDTGTSIASGSQTQTWDTSTLGAENNTKKNTDVSVTVASAVTFAAGEILLLQLGAQGTTLVDATLGTTNYTLALDVDDADTKITWASGQGIRQACTVTQTATGEGLTSRGTIPITMTRDAVGEGLSSSTKATVASKSFDVVGEGLSSRQFAVAEDFDVVGEGLASAAKATIASKSFTVTGAGVKTVARALTMARTAAGEGLVSAAKATVAAKSFDVVGEGKVTEIHPVQAFRTFSLTGKGAILTSGANGSTITVPLDELPTGEGGETVVVKKPIYLFDD